MQFVQFHMPAVVTSCSHTARYFRKRLTSSVSSIWQEPPPALQRVGSGGFSGPGPVRETPFPTWSQLCRLPPPHATPPPHAAARCTLGCTLVKPMRCTVVHVHALNSSAQSLFLIAAIAITWV